MESSNRYKKIQDERMIGTSDLVLEFARRIWLIIIAVILFAGLLGGYKYIKDVKRQNESENVSESGVTESELTTEEFEQVKKAKNVIRFLEQQEEYAENSILQQMDAYNMSVVFIHFYLSIPDVEQYTDDVYEELEIDLKDAYCDYVLNGALFADLGKMGVEIEPKYLGEIISCENMEADGERAYRGHSFDVKVRNIDEESCKELADQIVQCITEYQNTLDKQLCPNTITVINQSYSEQIDSDTAKVQANCMDQISALEEKVTQLKDGLNERQLTALGGMSQENEDGERTETAAYQKPKISKKYLVMGAGIGFVLAIAYITIAYLIRGTVNSVNDIRYIYNKRVMGEISVSHQNRFYRFCSRKLRSVTILTQDQEIDLLIANLKNECRHENIQKVLMGGICKEEDISSWMPRVKDGLKAEGIETVLLDKGLENLSAANQMNEIKEIVLIEKMLETRYETLTREIEFCMEQNMHVLGVIAVK